MQMSGKAIYKLFCLITAATVWLTYPAKSQNVGNALPPYVIAEFGQPPVVPDGQISETLSSAIQIGLLNPAQGSGWGRDQTIAVSEIADSGDPRVVWIIADLMRFATAPQLSNELGGAAAKLLGITPPRFNHWGIITDHLIAWDIPAPPDYLASKRVIFTSIIDGWDHIFVEGDVDWRHVSWGGVPIDARGYDTTDEDCNCIPAADNPAVSSVAEATWLKDDDVIFGIAINGEARAYPRRIMEVREMINDTVGGRDLGIPYCTLCGAAQAYFTDRLPAGVERPVLRTSGLLIRSNKVMYDITSGSVFDTFKGTAVTGPLLEKGIKLEQASVVTTTWGEWKKTHPDTTVLVEALALGRDFDFRNGRDANGPIFPVGDVDPRLPVQEDIVGLVTKSGKPIAFQRSAAMLVLSSGQEVKFDGGQLVLTGGGIKAIDDRGNDLGSHQAFWFAWSQFYPDTALWTG